LEQGGDHAIPGTECFRINTLPAWSVGSRKDP
jgi:hypothetical protein